MSEVAGASGLRGLGKTGQEVDGCRSNDGDRSDSQNAAMMASDRRVLETGPMGGRWE